MSVCSDCHIYLILCDTIVTHSQMVGCHKKSDVTRVCRSRVCTHAHVRARRKITQISCDIVTSIYLQTIQMIIILCHICCHIQSHGVTLLSSLESRRLIGGECV